MSDLSLPSPTPAAPAGLDASAASQSGPANRPAGAYTRGRDGGIHPARHTEPPPIGWKQLRRRPIATTVGILTTVLGIVVIVGWHLGQTSVVQIAPGLAPMQYNTALAFVACGIAFGALAIQRTWPGYAGGGLAAALGALTLLQYIFGIDLGIDQLLFTHPITTATSHPGRMAPNTAVCFVYAGAALLLLARQKDGAGLSISGTLGGLVLSLSCAALGGYVLGLEPAYGWGELTAMAAHTAAGFIVCGSAIVFIALRRSRLRGQPFPMWLAICAGLAVLALTLVLWQAIQAVEARLYPDGSARPSVLGGDILPLFGAALAIALTAAIAFAFRAQQRAGELSREIAAKEAAQARSVEAEIKRKEAQRLLQDAVERASVQIAIFGADERMVLCNQAYWQNFFPGRPKPDLLPTFTDLMETSLTENLVPELANADAAERATWIRSRVETFRTGEGSVVRHLTDGRWLSVLQQRLPDGGTMIVQTDVSEIKAKEAEAAEARKLLDDAIENVTVALGVFGPDERMIICNEAYWQHFNPGVPRPDPLPTFREVMQNAAARRIVPELIGASEAEMDAWVQHRLGQFRKGTWSVVREMTDGRWLKIIQQAIPGGGTLVAFTDVSELKAREKELLQSNQELERFAYVASHDLQEPLRKIRTFSGLLSSRHAAGLSETATDIIARMQNAAERMQTLIRDLLDFSRAQQQEQQWELVDLNHVVATVVGDLEQLIQDSGASVEIGQLPTIEADRTQMGQLFQNLISNALKFRRPDVPPRVSIQWRNEAAIDGAELASIEERSLAMTEITVHDNGIGIAPKHLGQIFDVFKRLHSREEYAGTGVGLAVCRRVVERTNGKISVDSSPGEGTTFTVQLPMRQVLEIA